MFALYVLGMLLFRNIFHACNEFLGLSFQNMDQSIKTEKPGQAWFFKKLK
jgi:hypothetical protein